MLLKNKLKSCFSTSRIDFKRWLRNHEFSSAPKPKNLFEDNPEYQEYKKKIKNEAKIDEMLKFDDRYLVHGIEPPRKVENFYSFIDISEFNIVPYQPDNNWRYEDFILRYSDIPENMVSLVLDDFKEDDVDKDTLKKAIGVISDRLKEENKEKINITEEIEELAKMNDEEFNKKYKIK